MGDDRIVASLLDCLDGALELLIGERLHLAARAAHEVVVMGLAGRLVPHDAVADVDPLHEAVLVEPVEHAVDACEADLAAVGGQRVVDLLGAEAARLHLEVLEHDETRSARPVAGLAQLVLRVCGPTHWTKDNENRYRLREMMRIVLALLLAAVLTACGPGTSSGGRSVVAAFYPLAWAAEQIGGPAVHVHNLTPPGAEPHDIELTPQEVGEIQTASVVLYLSHDFQPAVAEAVRGARGTTLDVLQGQSLAAGVGDEAGKTDPHVWLDPVRFAGIIERIGTVLRRPKRAHALAGRVLRLNGEYRRGLAHCARREFVTSHAAFAYLAARYHLHMVAITGIDPQSEPTPQKLASLIELVRRDHIRTVFFERLVSPKLAQTVAREAHAQAAVLDPIEGLTPGEQKQGFDYLTLMRQNLRALRQELGCR